MAPRGPLTVVALTLLVALSGCLGAGPAADGDPAGGDAGSGDAGGGAAGNGDGPGVGSGSDARGGAGPPPAPPAPTGWRFEDVTEASGVRHQVGARVPPGHRHMDRLVGAVSAADVDGDGWVDLFVGDAGANSLWRNNGDWTFTDVTAEAGVAGAENTTMGLFFDHDGDGDQDLYVVNLDAASRLYRNDGGFRFTDVTAASGLGARSWAYGAAAADADGDGDLDVSVVNYGPWPHTNPEAYGDANNGERDFLFINQGNGTFTEEALARGVNATRWTFSHAWHDVDGDGDQDLYANVDFGFDLLYENDGAGRFRDAAAARGLVTHRNGMGAVWTDVDNDLHWDLFVTNIYIEGHDGVDQFMGNNLFVGDANGTFRDRARARGVADGGWGWDSEWEDFDHDGDVDGYQANGMVSAGRPDLYDDARASLLTSRPPPQPYQHTVSQRFNATHWLVLELQGRATWTNSASTAGYQSDRFFLNDGAGRFRDAAFDVGFADWPDTRGVASADLDGDGDLDLVRAAWGRGVELFRNLAVETAAEENATRHWLQVDLVGAGANGAAVGAVVTVEAGNLTMARLRAASGGFMSQSHRPLHFGLGDRDVVDALVVRWPGGGETRLEAVAADQVVTVRQGPG